MTPDEARALLGQALLDAFQLETGATDEMMALIAQLAGSASLAAPPTK